MSTACPGDVQLSEFWSECDLEQEMPETLSLTPDAQPQESLERSEGLGAAAPGGIGVAGSVASKD